jgi:hypothetical protein
MIREHAQSCIICANNLGKLRLLLNKRKSCHHFVDALIIAKKYRNIIHGRLHIPQIFLLTLWNINGSSCNNFHLWGQVMIFFKAQNSQGFIHCNKLDAWSLYVFVHEIISFVAETSRFLIIYSHKMLQSPVWENNV